MNAHEYPDDAALIDELRQAVSTVTARERPPLAAITSRAQVRQRRQRAAFAGLGLTGAAASAVLGVALAGALGAAPGRGTGTPSAVISAGNSTRPSGPTSTVGAGTITTAAFTLASNADGTDTLTLNLAQVLDPAALQQALAQHNIPALVKTDTYCISTPAAPDPDTLGVLTVKPPLRPSPLMSVPATAVPGPNGKPPSIDQLAAKTTTIINPAAMPAGLELFFGYYNHDHLIFVDLINTGSYTCHPGPPPATR
jgi:hypothetical protein